VSPYSADACAPRRARGFSLLEVLVAFVILALALGVIMRVFSQGMSRVSESDAYARAVTLAQSKLAQLGADIPLAEGELSGEGEDALRWRVRLGAYEADKVQAAKEAADTAQAANAGSAAPAPLPVRLWQVEVEVSWDADQTPPRSVRLATLKLAPRRLQ
jgi:general secretion pathway protein I